MAGQEGDGERVIARLRRHGRALVWPTVALAAIAFVLAYFGGRLPEEWQNVALLIAAAVLAIALFVIPLLRWLSLSYTITTRRLILRRGLLVRVRQELLHSRGYDLTVRKSALQSMFGSGDLLINTGLEHPVVLEDVPKADLVQDALHDLMESNMNPVAFRRQQSSAAGETVRFETDELP
ncbi:PH domain-containing protein [Herbiconiux sp. SYSU D00978]|uniref:PH domain-containing protein n=1 Tax=Herbiconiux sp. SYSU D00978 TaxID=2812562 RepID=UPI001F61FBCB|nr:PH domain-containing protein [Herbiconiux sp. SYSU D00978]